MSNANTKYATGRQIANVSWFLGVIIALTGVLGALYGSSTVPSYAGFSDALLAMLPGLGLAFSGFIFVMSAELGVAIFDIADNSGENKT